MQDKKAATLYPIGLVFQPPTFVTESLPKQSTGEITGRL